MPPVDPPFPPARNEGPAAGAAGAGFYALGVAALIITALYLGREVFVPVALAILLSFVLAPLVRLLQGLHVPRSVAVIGVVLLTTFGIAAIAGVMASQVAQLAGDLPRYQQTMREKIASLKGSTGGSSPLSRAADVLQDLSKEIERPQAQGRQGPAPSNRLGPGQARSPEEKPVPVEVRPPQPTPLETLTSVLAPLLHPLATLGIVVVFVVFILLQREDLRNRMIRLAGAYDLQKTTAALDDAAKRLSRLFLTQLAVNTGFGIVIGVGLWLIGVPSPVLWGVFAAILRFVPYVGAVIGALLPMSLAVAVDPGWSMLIWTAALFVLVEPLVGHVIEPLLYGHSTGLSPVAVIAAATFWTWLWGPVGLVLATPLTVCLVVLGRHVERLEFLDVMLGDKPALSPPEIFYQRMLACDPAEAADVAERFLKERPLSAYYDMVAVPGLQLARADTVRGALDETRLGRIRNTVAEVVEDLSDHDDVLPKGQTADDSEAEAAVEATASEPSAATLPKLGPDALKPAWRGDAPVLCIAGQDPLDEAAALMLAQLLDKHGLRARVEPADVLSTQGIFRLEAKGVALICLSYLDTSSPAHQRYAVRRLRRKLSGLPILLGQWGASASVAAAGTEAAKADLAARSLCEAVALCLKAAQEDAADTSRAEPRRPAVGAA